MGSAWIDKGDTLFVDRALALQVPYDRPDAPVAPTTISTAHEAGWTWDIGLPDRRGTGYVYSSRHTTDERAEQILRGYVGQAGEGLTPRLLKLKIGHRDRHWIKNCVAVGLSGGLPGAAGIHRHRADRGRRLHAGPQPAAPGRHGGRRPPVQRG
jgi:tryptophan halogenase